MKRNLLKRSLLIGVAALTSVGALATSVQAASAGTVITAAGSDTTEKVMNDILSSTYTPSGDAWYNIPAYPAADISVPGDAYCPTISFAKTTAVAPGIVAPNGSGAGRNALRDYIANANKYLGGVVSTDPSAVPVTGCVDIARSSGFSSASPAAGTGEYYAFALDAVSWASGSLSAPATMTPSDLRKIWDCTYTDWSQLPGGGAGPIQRYLPPDASGTTGFFKSDLLDGFNPASVSNASCPAVKRLDKNGNNLEENRADLIPQADWQKAIFPYSAGQWVYQANNAVNPTIDHRQPAGGGFMAKLGGLNMSDAAKGTGSDALINNANAAAWNRTDGVWQLNDAGLETVQAGDPGGYPIVEGNTTKASGLTPATVSFRGVRFVYNVLDTRSPSYLTALDIVGFDNISGGTKSSLCSGGRRSIISSYGFAPLTNTVNGTSNIAGATCRKYLA